MNEYGEGDNQPVECEADRCEHNAMYLAGLPYGRWEKLCVTHARPMTGIVPLVRFPWQRADCSHPEFHNDPQHVCEAREHVR